MKGEFEKPWRSPSPFGPTDMARCLVALLLVGSGAALRLARGTRRAPSTPQLAVSTRNPAPWLPHPPFLLEPHPFDLSLSLARLRLPAAPEPIVSAAGSWLSADLSFLAARIECAVEGECSVPDVVGEWAAARQPLFETAALAWLGACFPPMRQFVYPERTVAWAPSIGPLRPHIRATVLSGFSSQPVLVLRLLATALLFSVLAAMRWLTWANAKRRRLLPKMLEEFAAVTNTVALRV